MSPTKIVLSGVIAVVAYDAAASVASLAFAFPYASAGVGSLLIYGATGFFAARSKSSWFSVVAGAIVGFTDATVGWGISWALGPGRVINGSLTVAQWLVAASIVVVLASVCAALCGIVARFIGTRRSGVA